MPDCAIQLNVPNPRNDFIADYNKNFALKKISEWIIRALNSDPIIDDELVNMVIEIIKYRFIDVSERLIKDIENISKRGKIKREVANQCIKKLKECEDEIEDYGHAIERIIGRTKGKINKHIAKHICDELEAFQGTLQCDDSLDMIRGAQNLQKAFHLNRIETDICLLFYIVQSYRKITTYFTDTLEIFESGGRGKLAIILGISLIDLNRTLNGKLWSLELIEFSRFTSLSLNDEIFRFFEDPEILNRSNWFAQKSTAPSLPLSYFHVDTLAIDHIKALLSVESDTPSHILLYGPPGTGKTSFARSIAAELGKDAYYVAQENRDQLIQRRLNIEASVNMTSGGKDAIVIVDEADAILATVNTFLFSGDMRDKGWLNEFLERSGLKLIWIVNKVEHIDPSVLRRFSFSVYFKPLNQGQRMQLLRTVLKEHKVDRLLEKNEIRTISKKYNVSAGVIDTAVSKAKMSSKNKSNFYDMVILTLDSHEQLINGGKRPIRSHKPKSNFSLEFINVNGLQEFLSNIQEYDAYLRKCRESEKIVPPMNILFHGPPGTGKSELAKYIADLLDREILLKLGSDLLNPFVGMSEKHIAWAFEQAESKEGILLIDEVDTFLFSRNMAHRSWESSLVNEFLARMEQYQGIMICTTNRFDGLDEASLRRFLYKLEFDYLSPHQLIKIYETMIVPIIGSNLNQNQRDTLSKLNKCTPGDIVNVVKKLEFCRRLKDHDGIIHEISAEIEIKTKNCQEEVGFLSRWKE